MPATGREQIVSELADCANYVHMLAMHLGVELEAEMLRKLIEVEQRPGWKGAATSPLRTG